MASSRLGKIGINIFNPQKILFFLCLMLLVFPKGGIKISNIPITWGYLFLGVISFFCFFRKGWIVHSFRIQVLLCLLPFQVVSGLSLLFNGMETVGWTISFLISFFFLPFVFLFSLSEQIETMDLEYFLGLFRKGVVFISCYGLFLFLFKQFTGSYVEIPLLTINLGDMGDMESKCNNRGLVSKLISTYNNGQIFGVSVLMLLPLYCYIEKNNWKRLLTKLALILTFSRTVWIGLLIHEVIYPLFVVKNKRKAVIGFLFMISFSLAALCFVANYYGFTKMFFLDSSLGGRKLQVTETLNNYSFFPSKKFLCLLEMTYLSILDFFGSIGLFTYLVGMIGPLFLSLQLPLSRLRICILVGLINYTIVAFADGATQYIPVLAFFWFLVSLLMRRNLDCSLRYQ